MGEKVSGVYLFINNQTGKVYVGSAKDVLKRRRAHLNNLTKGKHENTKLQRSWNYHGPVVWTWFLVERCPSDLLIPREQHWIDWFDAVRTGYNICPIAGSPGGKPHTDESKKKISDAAKISQRGERNGFFGGHHTENTKAMLRKNLAAFKEKSIEGTRRQKKGKTAAEIYGNEIAEKISRGVADSNRRRTGCALVFNPKTSERKFVRPETLSDWLVQGWVKGHRKHFLAKGVAAHA